jgi:hypothetical protein
MVTDSQAAKFQPITPDQLIIEVNGIYAGLLWWKLNAMKVDVKQHQAAWRWIVAADV